MKLVLTTALAAGVALYAPIAWADDEGASEVQSEEEDAYERDLEDTDAVEDAEEQPIQHEAEGTSEVEDVPLMEPTQTEETSEPEQPATVMPEEEDKQETDIEIHAAPPPEPEPAEIQVMEEPKKGPGFSVSAGGGVFGFAGDANDLADEGGAYTARLGIGTRQLVGFEVAYVGTAQDVDALGLDDDAVLISNGVEGVARLNIGTFQLQPYILGGVGWKRYDMVNEDFNTSSIEDNDDVIEFPVGGGLSWRYEGFLLDGRGTYNFATEEDLIADVATDDQGLDTWNVTLKAGVEF